MERLRKTVTQEEWLPVVGYERTYAVSSEGRVKRTARGKRTRIGLIREPTLQSNGYLAMTMTQDARKGVKSVHRMVLEAFVGPCPPGKEANHKDGIKTNNRISNLEWITHGENIRHAHATNLKPVGSAISNS
jgi:hypothetical protein